MRIFLIPGLMAATMLTPAVASAADVGPNLNRGAGMVQTDLTAAAQRDSRGDRSSNRGSGARQMQRQGNRDNRGQARVNRQARTEARAERAVNTTPVPPSTRSAARPDRPDRNVNLAARRDQRVERRVDNRTDRRQDIRQGDRNRDGRVDRRYDRNRNGQIDRRYDRNNNDRVDRRVDRDRDGRIDQRYRNNRNDARSSRNWNRSWRNDKRYDWQRYRQANRNHYRVSRYYAPYRDYRYRRLSIGISLGSAFYGSRYWINNPSYYRLPPTYPGTRWVRYYEDVLLIDTYSGEVVDVIYDFFW